MKVFNIVFISVLSVIFIVAIAFFAIGYFKPKPAGIAVRALPDSNVYLDGKLIGRTPIDTAAGPGSAILKIIPDEGMVPFEAKINLVSGVKTIVKREFGNAESSSSGEIVSFEKVMDEEFSGYIDVKEVKIVDKLIIPKIIKR